MGMDQRVAESSRRPRRGSRLVAWAVAPALVAALGSSPHAARAQGAPPDTVVLGWTSPGDDGIIGTALQYQLRVSLSPIDESNWSAATLVGGAPAPLPAGTYQTTVARGLTFGTTYYFAIRTVDDAGNWSGISNLVRWDWFLDTAPPAAPSGLAAALRAGGGVALSWSPNAEPDLAGYVVYRALTPGGPYGAVNGALVTATSYVDVTIPAGTADVWYQVSARDITGNESARSSASSVSLTGETAAWVAEGAYPNPSRAGTLVQFPLVVPEGAGEARIEIANSIGQRVRRLDLGTLAPGTQAIQWDGRSDAGREVAPGAYTAWLIAGRSRIGIRLVRLP